MSDNFLLEKILDLPEFEITDLKHNEHDINFYVHTNEKPPVCPSCGVVTPRLPVQQNRPQVVRDISIQHKHVGLFIDRIKFKCMDFGLAFIAPLQSVPKRAHMTACFQSLIAERAKTSNFINLEHELDILNVTIRQIFLEEMDILPKLAEMIARLRAMLQLHRIEVVTMDMWQPYRDAIKLACVCDVVLDKFHVVKMANQALNQLRIALRADMTKRMKKDLNASQSLKKLLR